jgi:hypothetical protein
VTLAVVLCRTGWKQGYRLDFFAREQVVKSIQEVLNLFQSQAFRVWIDGVQEVKAMKK